MHLFQAYKLRRQAVLPYTDDSTEFCEEGEIILRNQNHIVTGIDYILSSSSKKDDFQPAVTSDTSLQKEKKV
jgi:hypothetical protein